MARDGDVSRDFYQGPSREVLTALSGLDKIFDAAAGVASRNIQTFDNSKFKRYQFPTIDHDTITSITYAVTTIGGIRLVLKDMRGLLDDVYKLVKKLKQLSKLSEPEAKSETEKETTFDGVSLSLKIKEKDITIRPGDDIEQIVLSEVDQMEEASLTNAEIKQRTPGKKLAANSKRAKGKKKNT